MFEHKNWKVYAPNTDVVGGGGTESVIQPKTRFEYFLDKIAKALGGGESGAGGGSFVIKVNDIESEEFYISELDKTWQEINDALLSGKYCLVNQGSVEDDGRKFPYQLHVIGTGSTVGQSGEEQYVLFAAGGHLDWMANGPDESPLIKIPKRHSP